MDDPSKRLPRLGDHVIRRPRTQEYRPLHLSVPRVRTPGRRAGPLTLIYGFLTLILLGTVLLLLPICNTQGGFTPFLTALFTATSAVTVTGLIVVETAENWSGIGQAVILALIFLGGLGFMTGATFLLILIGRRITLGERLLVRDVMGRAYPGGVVGLVRRIVVVATVIQGVGWGFMVWVWKEEFSGDQLLWQSLFHAVSAFNNAGFSILPGSTSLAVMTGDVPGLLVMGVMIVLGGISFTVLGDVVEVRQPWGRPPVKGLSWLWNLRIRRFSRLTLDTKMVLVLSASLWIIGAVVIFASEYSNPHTMGHMSIPAKLIESVFQSISVRTAGFSTIDYGAVEQHTTFFTTALMFIGGASASTAGGIKVSTFGVLLWTVWSSLRGHSAVLAFGREVPEGQVHRALVVLLVAILLVFLVVFTLALTEEFAFLDIFFEAVSAFATNGLSTGLTKELSGGGQFIVALAMFVGRLGPLTLALALAQREETALYRYTEERVRIG